MARECCITTPNSSRIADTFRKEANYLSPKRTKCIVECGHVEMATLDAREEFVPTTKPNEDTKEISLAEGDTKRTVKVGRALPQETKALLAELLRKYQDVFAFSTYDILDIDQAITSHHLNINPNVKPVKQKKRTFLAEKNRAILEEVDKLLKAGFIRACQYPESVANAIMLEKANGAWRMYVDFTDLHKACSKDSYPLPRISQLVDATGGHALLSFMDAFSWYHQIYLPEPDQEKIAFIIERGLYYYKMMSFG